MSFLIRRNALHRVQSQTFGRCISSSALTIQHTTESKLTRMPPKEELQFGTTFSDHMLTIKWSQKEGWDSPKIVPFGDLKIHPAASSLHYGLECFEGMKAYKSLSQSTPKKEELLLFRPELNLQRLETSMSRLEINAPLNHDELLTCIKELVTLDRSWIPRGEGYSMYIRPTVISTHAVFGLAAPTEILLYVITSPVGPYYKTGFEPVRLTADTEFIRAWPGGTGDCKIGGNYAPTMKPGKQANDKGYSQVLWTLGEDHDITEAGSMNVFFLLRNKQGVVELVTPPLSRGDILPGVTRRSIIELCKSWGEFEVNERNITMIEFKEAVKEGRMMEAFGAGTAAVVSPIGTIQFQGEDLEIHATGDVTKRIWDELTAIQYGKTDHQWSVVC